MEKYYISMAENQLRKSNDALEFLEDAISSLRDGKQFDCMDKLNKVHDIIVTRLIRDSNSVIGNLKLDAEKHKEFRDNIRFHMYEYIPQYVSVTDYTDLELLEAYLSYRINRVTIEDSRFEDGVYSNVNITPISEIIQEFIEYKLTNK